MSKNTSKKRRTIKPRTSGDGEKLYWSMVDASDWLEFCDIAVVNGISVTPSRRRDQQALAIRFWHPDYELQTIYFGLSSHGDTLSQDAWEYLAQIIAEMTGKDWSEVLDQLRSS